MRPIPPISGFVAPSYDPLEGTPPKVLRWRGGPYKIKGVPEWVDYERLHRPGSTPEMRELRRWSWSDPVWIWCEGRDGRFLLSSSFVILDLGYWSGGTWEPHGSLHLYLATHGYMQVAGPEALSLTPPHKQDSLARVLPPSWTGTAMVKYAGVSERPVCYEAPLGLPWESLMGTANVEVLPGDRRKAEEKRTQIERVAQRFFRAHESPAAARATFEKLLQAAEDGPCEAANGKKSGWWNENMVETFRREVAPITGQVGLFDLENWQLFTVDKVTGEWIPIS